jgi:signal transduction histidine kinase/ActR/RegA family two-component response regulator
MPPFASRPIRQKVAILIAFASAFGLLLAALALLLYDITTFKPRVLRDATTQAELVRLNTLPALTFDDSAAAAENLAALAARREIATAAIFRADGRLFAAYKRPGTLELSSRPPTEAGAVFAGGRLILTERLLNEGQPIGWLRMQYLLPGVGDRLIQYAVIGLVVLLALLTAGVLLLDMLGRSVSQPLLALAGATRSITERRDFRVRVPAGMGDEIGTLSAAFNEMVATVQRHEQALQESEARLRLALEAASLATWMVDLTSDPSAHRSLLAPVHPDDRPEVERTMTDAIASGTRFEVEFRQAGAPERWTALRGQAVLGEDGRPIRVVGVAQDITTRRQLELQLLQAQKMEAIGNLAGGIAHDFNNLLTGMIGYLRFIHRGLPPGSLVRADVEQVEQAANRAAALTSQLLAYARRQMVVPTLLNLNTSITALEPMLRRLLGEDVEIVTALDASLATTRIDPGQFEQVVVNLAVNARDAMPNGGTLRISTTNTYVEPGAKPATGELRPGAYVKLTVSDTGTGMTPEVMQRIFEPFFTTKGPGQGTGLGLAMCYGIIKQAEGHIEVSSEPGRGSTFTVYLPRAVDRAAPAPDQPRPLDDEPVVGGTETVLLAEDESSVRGLAARALREAGYTVLEAAGSPAAEWMAAQHEGTIDLLVTDVVMPTFNGRELAQRVCRSRPGLRVLYISGYAADAAVRRGVLEEGAPFLAKPFTPADLTRAVRRVLDAPRG